MHDIFSHSNVFMAPMAGITDRPWRTILASCGQGNLISEMAAVNAIQRQNPKSYQIANVKEIGRASCRERV